jgi:hypothetical protein
MYSYWLNMLDKFIAESEFLGERRKKKKKNQEPQLVINLVCCVIFGRMRISFTAFKHNKFKLTRGEPYCSISKYQSLVGTTALVFGN